MLGIVGVFGFNFFFFLGMKHTEAMNGALIMATNPLVTTLLASFILREKIIKRQGIGMLLALLGVCLCTDTRFVYDTTKTYHFQKEIFIFY